MYIKRRVSTIKLRSIHLCRGRRSFAFLSVEQHLRILATFFLVFVFVFLSFTCSSLLYVALLLFPAPFASWGLVSTTTTTPPPSPLHSSSPLPAYMKETKTTRSLECDLVTQFFFFFLFDCFFIVVHPFFFFLAAFQAPNGCCLSPRCQLSRFTHV